MPSSRQDITSPEGREAQLRLIHAEVDAQTESYERRIQALDSRAGLLVAAAALAGSLVSEWNQNGWLHVAIVLSMVSALLGAASLIPRKAKAIEPTAMRKAVYGRSESEALLWLIDHKIERSRLNEKRASAKGYLLQFGFVSFALSATFVVLSTTPLQVTF